MKSKLAMALVAAGMMGFGIVAVNAEEAAATAAPAATAPAKKKGGDKMMAYLEKNYPTEMAEIKKLKETDPAAAEQKLKELKAKAKADMKAKKNKPAQAAQ